MTPLSPAWRNPPPPLRANERGTYTEHSVVQRLPEILKRTIVDNEFSPIVQQSLRELSTAIGSGVIETIADASAEDYGDWQRYVEPHLGRSFVEAPWFFVENYVYRRIMQIVGHFERAPAGVRFDPFARQKRLGLTSMRDAVFALTQWLSERRVSGEPASQVLHQALKSMLWGNRVDLSLWPLAEGRQGSAESGRMLVDESSEVVEYLKTGAGSLALLIDNAGYELVTDLVLADLLLGRGLCQQVSLELKAHPTFVSDATEADLEETLSFFEAAEHKPTRELGRRLERYAETGSLSWRSEFFYNSPLAFWDLPAPLFQRLGRFDLVVSKGDANYRRWLGDRHWRSDAALSEILGYAPAPVLLVRTCKSEVLAGAPPDRTEQARIDDPDFLINGQWGLLQFVVSEGGP